MSEKPEALRLADRMAEGTGLDTQWDAAKELRRLHAENERLREALEKVVAADDDPNDKLTYIRGRLLEEIKAALRREGT